MRLAQYKLPVKTKFIGQSRKWQRSWVIFPVPEPILDAVPRWESS